MRIGLYFGSFNPIHVGHIKLAETVLATTDINKVIFVLSPHNPKKHYFDNYHHRTMMVSIAIKDNRNFWLSNLENEYTTPSYTCRTLHRFEEDNPQHTFSIIMGTDTLFDIPTWKNFKYILQHDLIVFSRYIKDELPLYFTDEDNLTRIKFIHSELLNISSTLIRKNIAMDIDCSELLDKHVYDYIKTNNLYK